MMRMVQENKMPIWAARDMGNGNVIKSSVGTFRSVAQRWAAKYRNHEVVLLAEVEVPNLEENDNANDDNDKGNEVVANTPEPETPKQQEPVVANDNGKKKKNNVPDRTNAGRRMAARKNNKR